jgi:hypothetical protein
MEADILPSLTSPIGSCKIASKNISGVKPNVHMEKAMLILSDGIKDQSYLIYL